MNTIVSLVFLFVVSVYGAQGFVCSSYCDWAWCESIESLKRRCKGGLVSSLCGCCFICGKVEGERCREYFTSTACSPGLFCKYHKPYYDGVWWRSSHYTCEKRTSSAKAIAEFWRKVVLRRRESPSFNTAPIIPVKWTWDTMPEPERSHKTTELPTVNSTVENEFPTLWQNILKTTETSYSGDESGDISESSGEETEEPTSKWSWFSSPEVPEPQQTQETTELPTVNPTEENEGMEFL